MATVGQPLLAPESGWKRYDNKEPGITYTGTWTSGTAAGNYSDTYTWSNTAGSSVSFKFKGTKIRIIADSNSGADSSVKITIDGVVDHYSQQSPSTLLQVLVFEKEGLSNDVHQVTIERQNGPTSLDAVDTDGSIFVPVGSVLATPQTGWTRVEETDDGIQYDTSWFVDTYASNSGGSQKYVNSGTHWIKFKFYGTKFRYIGNANTDRTPGNVNTVVIDGVSKGGFSQYATSNGYKILNYESDELPFGLHEVQITTSGVVGFDAIDIDGSMPVSVGSVLTAPQTGWKRIDNTDPLIGYTGSWTNGDHAQASSATETYTTSTLSSITFAFHGTKVRLIGSGYNTGSSTISVSIDGGAAQNASQNYSVLKRQMLFYEKDGLSEGIHTVRITNGQSANLWFDAVDIDSSGYLVMQVGQQLSIPQEGWKRYEQSFGGITYGGTGWLTESNAFHSGGSMTYCSAVGTSQNISFSFFGERIRIISVYHTSHPAIVNIDIDGVTSQFTLNDALTYRVLAFEKLGLSRGFHSVNIWVPAGQPLGPRLDAVDIDSYGTLGTLPATTGKLRTSISEMEIGDYIPINYNSATATYAFGTGDFVECPVGGMSNSTSRYLYMIKVDKGLLIGDRIITNTISWDALNSAGYIQGVANGPLLAAIRDFQANTFGTELVTTGGTVTINGTNDITLTASATAAADRTAFNRSIGKVFLSFEIDPITKKEFETNSGGPRIAIAITKASPRSNVYIDISKGGVKIVDNNGSRYPHDRIDFTKFSLYFDDTTSKATIVLDNKYVYVENVAYKADTWSNTTNNQVFMGVKTSATARFKINNVALDVANTTRDITPLPNEGRMRAITGGVTHSDFQNLVPAMTADTMPFGVATASSLYDSGLYAAYKVFDKINAGATDAWASANNTTTGWVGYEFNSNQIIDSYSVATRNVTMSGEAPKDWTFEAWNGSDWVVLDRRSGITGWATAERRVFLFSNKTPYRKYRINITANNGHTYVAIGEMELFNRQGYGESFSATAKGFGAWPSNNEWDRYVVNFPADKIKAGKSVNDIFHWANVYTWTSDVPKPDNNYRINRGNADVLTLNWNSSSSASAGVGFRPVIEYKEV